MSYDRQKYARAYVLAINSIVSYDDSSIFLDQLNRVDHLLKQYPDLMSAFKSGQLPQNIIADLVDKLNPNGQEIVKRFLIELINDSKIELLTQIIDDYTLLRDKRSGTMSFNVAVTHHLTDDQKLKLEQILKSRLTLNKVKLDEKIDSSLIGGIIVKSNQYLIDDSIKTKLNRVKDTLLSLKINNQEMEV